MKRIRLIALALAVISGVRVNAAETEEGFTSLMDGKTFNGWKVAEENKGTWKIEDGAFVANGERCHLYYEGDGKPFKLQALQTLRFEHGASDLGPLLQAQETLARARLDLLRTQQEAHLAALALRQAIGLPAER